jgi:hypothetical protein
MKVIIVFNTMYILLKTLAFPAERLWALEPGFQCGGEEKIANLRFFLSCSALSLFFALVFLSSLFSSCSLASAKKDLAPNSGCYVA